MKKYVGNIELETVENTSFRRVVFTTNNSQLVVMSLAAGEDIGEEVHDVDQFLKVEQGTGKTILDGEESNIAVGFGIVVPAGVKHNVVNTGETEMKLYTVYSPPNHKDGTVHLTKPTSEDEEEHFDGQTSLGE